VKIFILFDLEVRAKVKMIKKLLYHADDIVASAALIILVGSTILGVFYRYALSDPLDWVEEVSLLCVVWFVFIGGSSATKRNGHVGIDFVIALFPAFVQKAACVFVPILCYAVLSFMAWWGWMLGRQAQLKVTNMLRIPYTYIDLAVPVGCILMMIHLALGTRRNWKALFSREKEAAS
jgi:TRAP-type C4-dicarboxylate transport system permease small subunit